MICPTCNTNHNIEIAMHADGFADNLLECSHCGTLWLNEFGRITIINLQCAA